MNHVRYVPFLLPMSILTYIFYPNPGNSSYTSPTMGALLVLCLLMLVASFLIRLWRSKLQNPVTKKLSRSWASVLFWFGLVGVILVVSRVEGIQFVAMRLWWGVWFLGILAFAFLQMRLFRAKHYEVLPNMRVDDPRDRYLPGRKRR